MQKSFSYKKISKWLVSLVLITSITGVGNAIAEDKNMPVASLELQLALAQLMPNATPTSVEETAMPGIFEVSYGTTIFYFNKDASLMFRGDLIDVKNRENLTEKKRGTARATLLNSMDESQMISYPAKDEKHKIIVFTDIDCPYCVKLHREVPEYNALGITVRYLAYPRAGIGSNSYNKAVSVWCSKDRQQAMTDAKNGKTVPEMTCDNTVAQQYQLGQTLGVQGTPAIFTEDGTMLPGYVPAKRLAESLQK